MYILKCKKEQTLEINFSPDFILDIFLKSFFFYIVMTLVMVLNNLQLK